ncbi:hypothetical protein EZV62_006155 [Acer yangbiense]|uniref:KIB1-4 beta-propeller domain-containing protein n=1 Tax=Acer yangbiense TaxID=1000413 RepID=A0A5C7IPM6_9ROSI|nr:hypothetical protein EZV62_006155 [Acer yangbiense]
MKMKMATKAGWSGLDDLALEDITGRMTLYRDFASLRMVCTSWRSSLQDFKFKCRMPWLMIPPKQGTNLREFFIFPQVVVFEVDLSTNYWTKMKDLGNKTLFLGSNSSICIESDGVYFKNNRIYFMDRYMDVASFFKKYGGKHMRVYNIEDGSIEPYFLSDSCDHLTPSLNLSTPPIFVEQ